jgi:hypothetical protein
MQIDMKLATIEWLDAWLARMAENPATLYFSERTPRDIATAQFRYVSETLDFYISGVKVSERSLVIFTGNLNGEAIRQLVNIEFLLEGGTAVIDYIDSEAYYEPYDREPSSRLEITFRVPKEGAL